MENEKINDEQHLFILDMITKNNYNLIIKLNNIISEDIKSYKNIINKVYLF